MIKEVLFQGLSHSPSDHESQEGELGTCLNLINEDGALHPIHQPVVVDSAITIPDGASIELIHKVTHDNTIHSHYITRNDNTWYWTEKGGNGTKNTISLNDFQVNAVSAIGNILCFVGEENTKYAYWNGSDYTSFDLSAINYSAVISNTKSVVCNSSINLGADWDSAFVSNKYYSNRTDTSLKGASIIFNALDALINKQLEENGKEYFKYTVFGVIAIRLYDGVSYINISNPFILAPETTFNKFIWYQETKAVGTSTILHTHSIVINMDIPEGLEDLISGVDVYLSQPESFIDTEKQTKGISRYKCYLWNDKMKSGVNCDAFQYLSEEDVYQSFEKKSFYLSTSISKDKFGTAIPLKRVLETEESISLADFQRSSFGGQCSITYNNRLHIGNVKKTIFNAFDTNVFSSRKVSNNQMYLNEYTDLATNNALTTDYICDAVYQVSISENSIKRDIYYKGKLQYPLSPILAYPSTLATAMTIYFYLPKYSKYYSKKVKLKPSETFGMSYYINISKNRSTPVAADRQTSNTLNNEGFGGRTDAPTETESSELSDYMYRYHDDAGLPAFMQVYRHKLIKSGSSGGDFGGGSTKASETSGGNFGSGSGVIIPSEYTWDSTSIDTGDFTEITEAEYNAALSKTDNQKYVSQQPNVVKVSEAENPMVFPAKNSVQVGSSIINALAANTRPISEGQFGEAPLYAFTDEGVWVLMLGEEGTYVARQPANREICSNPNGILQIDDAVLYPTNRGIMMQQGRNSICITDQLDGFPFNFMDMKYANQIIATNETMSEEISYIRFRDYLKSADMIYDYYDNRIIVFNPNQAYAYVYSLKSKMWGTMKNVFSKRVNIYPESYATNKEGKILNVYVEEPSSNTPYFLCSRPLTISDKEVYKTIFTCIARGYFQKGTNGKCAIVLYGSNNLFDWYLIKTSINEYLRGMAGSPYKYFRVALIGNLATNESISGLSAEFQERLQNKLR